MSKGYCRPSNHARRATTFKRRKERTSTDFSHHHGINLNRCEGKTSETVSIVTKMMARIEWIISNIDSITQHSFVPSKMNAQNHNVGSCSFPPSNLFDIPLKNHSSSLRSSCHKILCWTNKQDVPYRHWERKEPKTND
jgi:hypothetical protein